VVGLTLEFETKVFQNFLQGKIVERLQWFLRHDILPDALEGNFKGYFKLRVGDYRIIYEFEIASVVLVRLVGHRSRVCKDLLRLLDL
jgi:mRNA interferase RelE/StbE